MINWGSLAKEKGFATSKLLLTTWYFDQMLSASAIAQRLGISPPSVLNELAKRRIPKRKRGGANNTKDFSTGVEEKGG